MLLGWILLLFKVFAPGISYNVYSTIDKWTGTKYDCMYTDVSLKLFDFDNEIYQAYNPYHQPNEQIIPFCITVEHFTVNEESCITNGGIIWKFEQLEKQNITSHDLVNWNATVDIIDEYEHYLQTDNNQSNTFRFCNCTDKFHFGRQCQYTFDMTDEPFNTILTSHFSNLPRITDDVAAMMDDGDVTCFRRDISCHGGCLDWRQICNGIVDCSDSQDEASCDLLEFNECRDDEYRCRSGHCIPLIFAFDKALDCADGSDEENSFITAFKLDQCYLNVPNMFCDDFNDAWMKFPCGDGESIPNPFYSCANERNFRAVKQLYADDNTLCWQYLLCTLYLDYLFPLLVNCSALCGEYGQCSSFLSSVCHEKIVLFPPRPIMFSPSVYLVYQTNKSEYYFLPDFICYTRCDHLYSPTSKQYGLSCRSMAEFMDAPFNLSLALYEMVTDILHLFAGCTSNTKTSNSSLIFHCPLVDRAISYHRIKDGFKDCYFNSDESFNESTCMQNSTQQFHCWTSPDECIHRRFLQDYTFHCSDRSDEFYEVKCIYGTESVCDYQRGLYRLTLIQYEFKVIHT